MELCITMGRNGARDMAIVQVGHRGYAITERITRILQCIGNN